MLIASNWLRKITSYGHEKSNKWLFMDGEIYAFAEMNATCVKIGGNNIFESSKRRVWWKNANFIQVIF